MARSELAAFADGMHGLLGDMDELQRLWGSGADPAPRTAGHVLHQLADTFPQLEMAREQGLAARAFVRVKGASAAPLPPSAEQLRLVDGGELDAEHLEPFVAVVCYLHAMVAAFPVLGSVAAATVTYEQFVHMMGCLALSRPAAELAAVFAAMDSNSGTAAAASGSTRTGRGQHGAARVDFDEVVAWYAAVRCPTLAAMIHGAQLEAGRSIDGPGATAAAADGVGVDPLFWETVAGPVLDKKLRKEVLGKYAAADKHLFSMLNTDGGVARVFEAIDTNANSIVSLEELGTYLRARPCQIDSPTSIVRALLVATGRAAAVEDVAPGGGHAVAESAFTGNAWMARREFGLVFSLAVAFAKISDLFSLAVGIGDATAVGVGESEGGRGPPFHPQLLNMRFSTFLQVAKLLGIQSVGKKANAQRVFDGLRAARGQMRAKGAQRGWMAEAITLDDFVMWYTEQQCGEEVLAASAGGGSGGDGNDSGGGSGDGGRSRADTMDLLFNSGSGGGGAGGSNGGGFAERSMTLLTGSFGSRLGVAGGPKPSPSKKLGKKRSQRLSKKQRRTMAATAASTAEGQHVRFKALIALEGRVLALASPTDHQAGGHWRELDVQSNNTVSLVDFSTRMLGKKFPILDRPVTISRRRF
jgi:hypothetical protein